MNGSAEGPTGGARPPAVSIVIPTYNWSAALRCAIRSVLLQTFTDFEVLVVGDGCTDDSAAVVAAFDDPRLHWHNLERNHGAQWAPNNHGLRHARADWVAYLGHDDLWYPTHLEACLRAARASGADLVTSVMVLYGPPGSGIRAVAGVYPGGVRRADDYVPPSGWMHRRSITQQIGFWQPVGVSPLPSDCAFFAEALDQGLRVATTDELTAFKFSAAWRRDAYRTKSTAEQEAFLQRIETGTDFRHVELLDVLKARQADKLLDVKLPTMEGLSAESVHRDQQAYKGVAPRFDRAELRLVEASERFFLPAPGPGFEWHLEERDERFGPFRWSGPSRRSAVDLPVRFCHDLLVRMHILHAVDVAALDALKLWANDRPLECRVESTTTGTFLVQALARADPSDSPEQGLRLTLEVAAVQRPVDLGHNADHRWLGVAVNWIELEPAEASGPLPV